MNRNDREPDENQFADLLAAYDEALAAGLPADTPADSGVDSDLLPRLQSAQDFLRRLERHWPRAAAGTTPVPTQVHGLGSLSFDALSGTGQLGRFQLVRELGRGGHGIVFLAFDPVLQRQVALKIARPEILESAGMRHRFQQEARAAAGLSHPNLVPVHDTGEVGPFCYIVSAYCAGPTLAAWLKEHPDLPAPKAAASLVLRLAEAVATMHGRGIVHRDIKPSNVLLELSAPDSPPCPEGVAGLPGVIPKLTDFGLVKCLNGPGNETVSGAVLGTPAYMAPEQAKGQRQRVRFAADVYGLGAVLYELLTGVPPFQGATRLDTLRLVTSQEPRPPRELRSDLPVDLETICLLCLEKEPRRRYGSAQALAEDLQRFVDEKPIRARPPGLLRRIRKWRWGQRVAAGLAALGLLGAVALTWGIYEYSAYQEVMRQRDDDLRRAKEREKDQAEKALRLQGLLKQKGRNREANYLRDIQRARDAIAGEQALLAADILNNYRPADGEEDQRGFEWYYLWRACRPVYSHLGSHTEEVNVVKYSPDGKWLASADGGGTIKLWDPATRNLRITLKGHRFPVFSLAFAPDGKTLASAGGWERDGGEGKLWDVVNGKQRMELKGLQGVAHTNAFAPDGKTLVTASIAFRADTPSDLKQWDADEGKEVWSFKSGDHYTNFIFCPVTKHLLAGSSGGGVVSWDLVNKKGINHYEKVATGPIWAFAFNHDNTRLYAASRERCVFRWDVKTGKSLVPLRGFRENMYSVAYSPESRLLASSDMGGKIYLWDGTTDELLCQFKGHQGVARSVDFAPGGRTLASGSYDRTVKIWDVFKLPRPLNLRGHDAEVWAVAFAPDGKTVASGGDDHSVRLWEPATGKQRMTLGPHGSLVTCVAFSPDGNLLAAGDFDDLIKVWDVRTGELKHTLTGHKGHVICVAFSRDGELLATGARDDTVKFWNVQTGKERATLRGHGGSVNALVFAPDGKTLASGSYDQSIRLWDVRTRTKGRVYHDTGHVNCLVFTPDGETLVSANHRGYVCLWDIKTGRKRMVIPAHADEILSLALTPDGRTLATAGQDKTIKLWHLATATQMLTLESHQERVNAVAFSPDGSVLASTSHDQTVKLWHAAGKEEAETLK